ncbi:hypothetical protein PV783_16005 [Chitinophaga sp. CC14]|uniref:hypothetical protein n=1 Tax=Chitinophaga sp. CC14 TaxID=3029199 RepID=UPI003B7DB959
MPTAIVPPSPRISPVIPIQELSSIGSIAEIGTCFWLLIMGAKESPAGKISA